MSLLNLTEGDTFTLEQVREEKCLVIIDNDDGEVILLGPEDQYGRREDLYNLDTSDNLNFKILLVFTRY